MENGTSLTHHGVKGMKWGVRKAIGKAYRKAYNKALTKARNKERTKIKANLIADAQSVKVKAPKGKHILVTGRYWQSRHGLAYGAHHIVNDRGQVKMSSFTGEFGRVYIASAKSYIDKNVKLNEHFIKAPSPNEIEYDVYK